MTNDGERMPPELMRDPRDYSEENVGARDLSSRSIWDNERLDPETAHGVKWSAYGTVARDLRAQDTPEDQR